VKARLAVVAAVLVFAALLALTASNRQAAAQPSSTTKATTFSAAMDKLWEEHIVWTRMVIVDFAANLPDLKVAEARLLRNQADIGNAVKPYYGAAAGNKLTQLLRTHILEAVPVLVAARAGDKPKLNAALKAWYANAHQIAVFLSKANPDNWSLPMMDSMMKEHRQLTTAAAVARLEGHWSADVAAYDRVEHEILGMADMLSSGIVAQFPDKFAA
jgi:hypothetical protein